MKTTLKKEVAKVIKAESYSIVDERVLPYTLDNISDWAGTLIGKIANIDAENNEQQSEVYNELYQGLIKETIAQLQAKLVK